MEIENYWKKHQSNYQSNVAKPSWMESNTRKKTWILRSNKVRCTWETLWNTWTFRKKYKKNTFRERRSNNSYSTRLFIRAMKQNLGCLGFFLFFFFGDYIAQLNGDSSIPHYKDPVIKQPVFHGKVRSVFFFVAQICISHISKLGFDMLRLAGGMNHHQVTRAVPWEFLTYSTFQEAISKGTYLLQTPVCAGAIVVCSIDICLETVAVKKVNNIPQMVVKNADVSHGFESVKKSPERNSQGFQWRW